MTTLFEDPFWEIGPVEFRRVHWSHGRRARAQEAFNSAGLYLWGIEKRPLYIGITLRSFEKRFKRYIWEKKSQCNLAQDFGDSLRSQGIDGLPPKIIEWYERQYRGSKVRLRGAVRFAEEGIAGIWFALFPHNVSTEIEELERRLIPVANKWNKRQGLRDLLNKEFSSDGATQT